MIGAQGADVLNKGMLPLDKIALCRMLRRGNHLDAGAAPERRVSRQGA